MFLLGLARSIGGIALLLNDPGLLGEFRAEVDLMPWLAAGLLVVGIGEILSAIGVYRKSVLFWWTGIVITVLFVIGGVVNGWLLFGGPSVGGTIGNLIVATLIIGGLMYGRNTFDAQNQGKEQVVSAGNQ